MLNGNPKPEQLNKASEFTGLMDNMSIMMINTYQKQTLNPKKSFYNMIYYLK
ncbi:hypothetical protein ACVPOR_08430 [Staphylococcus aureus]